MRRCFSSVYDYVSRWSSDISKILSGYSSEEVAGYYKKMAEALKGADKKSTFEIANSIWVSKHLNVKEEFVSTVREYFASEERIVDFMDPSVGCKKPNQLWIRGIAIWKRF